MGCVTSKEAVLVTPALDSSAENEAVEKLESATSKAAAAAAVPAGSESLSFRLGNLHKYVEGEQVAAGWPAWLSAVAGDAIHGWVPLRSDSFEKLEKIGQGTYSSVFRARDLGTGKMVALKKVRFDNFEPESVRFMAREILVLRRLNHPNVIKLEGIITSRLSCSIYLVFEYMEHDLTGLCSCPDIKFSESQVKCYMKQLLSGLDHCHSMGVMHRDIKGSNILVSNEGVLKIADFGLANFSNLGTKQPLTSRVVTLWYRPPELLLGATDYGPSVDLWSVGCVFAEILLGKPLLQGRTEVEQLHKIFKLCGSPPDEYWKKSRLPHATLFKPQQHYESSFHETCKDLASPAANLIKMLLFVEPYKRVTASSALASEYFTTKPYACDPLSLPRYPPNKEIDAKCREEARKKKVSGRAHGLERTRKAPKKPSISKLAPAEALPVQAQDIHRTKINGNIAIFPSEDDNVAKIEPPKVTVVKREPPKVTVVKREEPFHVRNASQGDMHIPFSGPLQVSSSSGFAWAKRLKDSASFRSHSRSSSKVSLNGLEQIPTTTSRDKVNPELPRKLNHGFEAAKPNVQRQWSQFDRLDSFNAFDGHRSQELSFALYQKEMEAKRNDMDKEDKVEFSGPLLSQRHRIDELLEKHERRIRQAVRRSWFQRGKNHGK